MTTPRAVISIEVPALRSARVEKTFDADSITDASAMLVLRTEGESYFLAFDPTDLPMVKKAIEDYEREEIQ